MMDREKRAEAFMRARNSAMIVNRLERLAADEDVKKQPSFARMLARERLALQEHEKEARAYMKDLRPIEYSFVLTYYLSGMTLRETSETIDRSNRQCERFRKKFSP